MRPVQRAVVAFVAVTLSAVWVPAVQAAEQADASAELTAAIAASNAAYGSGVVSDVRGAFPFTSGPEIEVTDYSAGMVGQDLFSDSPQLTVAWMSDSRGVAVSAVPTANGKVSVGERADIMWESFARNDIDVPARVKRVTADGIAAAGGNSDSVVPLMDVPGTMWDEIYYTVFTSPANPAASIDMVLALASESTVTSEPAADGGTTFTVVATSSVTPDGAATTGTYMVHADAAGLIDSIEWDGEFAGWIKVAAYGDAVSAPAAAVNQLDTSILKGAADYLSHMFSFAFAVHVLKSELAQVSPPTKAKLRKAIAAVSMTEKNDYSVRSLPGGYEIRMKMSQAERPFGPLCKRVTVGKTEYKFRSCR